ncbi:MAG: hypothetical protein K2L49_06390 [Muribaculaceae bacterium]|nr:hypothetical protein [Muribaculaceae bacterium]
MTRNKQPEKIVQEQVCEVADCRRRLSLGLPAMRGDSRFPLTPEAAAMLVGKGVTVKIESGAALPIHYSDAAYQRRGAGIVSRVEALGCDIVLCTSVLDAGDIRLMRRGAMLLTMSHAVSSDAGIVSLLADRSVLALALDLIEDGHGNTPFADILDEISGRAAVTVASAMLADPIGGKGVLMGGVAGIVPCEITVIGSGIAASAAALAALGAGATVRMFDNDVYRLRDAVSALGGAVISSALHPHVLEGALRSADVVIVTPLHHGFVAESDMVGVMKRGVAVFDLRRSGSPGVFPSMQVVDMACDPVPGVGNEAGRVCYMNVDSRVPRTVAMAMSNAVMTLVDDILGCDGCDKVDSALKMLPGLRPSVITFLGKLVNREIGLALGLRSVDISLLISLS